MRYDEVPYHDPKTGERGCDYCGYTASLATEMGLRWPHSPDCIRRAPPPGAKVHADGTVTMTLADVLAAMDDAPTEGHLPPAHFGPEGKARWHEAVAADTAERLERLPPAPNADDVP